jgi:sugar phosphate isomerase/epimerase
MKIACCWMYAIGMYGFPPAVEEMRKAIQEMAAMGFQSIELEGMGYENLESVARNKELLKDECLRNGVQVVNFAPLIPGVISMDVQERRKAFDHFRIGVEVASYLGSARVWIDSYNPPLDIIEGKPYSQEIIFGKEMRVRIPSVFDWKEFWKSFVRAIKDCNRVCMDYGLELLIEPRVGEVTSNTDGLLRLFDAVPNENLGAILDVAHLYAQKELLPLSIEKLGEKIRYVHIADNDGRENRHLPMGEGTVDWDGVFKTLKRIGYKGFYAIDLEKLPDLPRKFVETKRTLEAYDDMHGLEGYHC